MMEFVRACWNAPARVRAVTTQRHGGVSAGPYDSLNLARHVGDRDAAVDENRRRLRSALALPGEPLWLRQVHGCQIVNAGRAEAGVTADGSVTDRAGVVCAVQTADCLPLFLCDRAGDRVGVFHVGWRGLVAGIIRQAVAALARPPEQLLAWLGPAIGPTVFEIGSDVKRSLGRCGGSHCFSSAGRADKWFANLYELTREELLVCGVADCSYDPCLCSYRLQDRFFSYRRDGVCGRMASLIWIATDRD